MISTYGQVPSRSFSGPRQALSFAQVWLDCEYNLSPVQTKVYPGTFNNRVDTLQVTETDKVSEELGG